MKLTIHALAATKNTPQTPDAPFWSPTACKTNAITPARSPTKVSTAPVQNKRPIQNRECLIVRGLQARGGEFGQHLPSRLGAVKRRERLSQLFQDIGCLVD